jgi:HEAT repeat protein
MTWLRMLNSPCRRGLSATCALACLLSILLNAGCQPGQRVKWPGTADTPRASDKGREDPASVPPPPPGKPLTRFAKYELRDRAENLLVNGTRTEIPLIVCNSIEALERVAPAAARSRVQPLLESESRMVRFAALVAIGRLRDRASAPRVQAALRDRDERVRLAAAFAAARLGDTSQVAKLVHALEKSSDENMRSDAAFLLGKLGEKRLLKRLAAAQRIRQNEQSNRVLVHILGARAELGDRQALQQLAAFTRGDSVSRILALQMLSELAVPEARPALAFTLNDKDEYLEPRLIAARGLGRLGLRSGYALARNALNFEGKNKDDPNETARVRSLAALALGGMRASEALEALRDLCANSSDERIQVAAATAICEIVGD